jgi:hypothetical protein
MPCYLFTLHAYRSWNADNPRGFVQTGRGIQPPNSALARSYDRNSKHEPIEFSRRHQTTIAWIALDACRKRGWRLHTVAFEPSHVHLLISWQSSDNWQLVRGKLKNLIAWALTKEFESKGTKWMVRKGSRKRVRDRKHFDYLITKYLPKHRGYFWKEGDLEPAVPNWAPDIGTKPPASAGG